MDLFNKVELKKVFEIPEVKLAILDEKKQTKQIVTGKLLLGEFTDNKKSTVIIIEENYQFPIFKELPFYVSEFQSFRSYIFPFKEDYYSIQIPLSNQQMIQVFEKTLSEISTILYNSVHLFQEQKEEKQETNMISGFIKTGGNMLSQGIQFGTSVANKGIETTANFLKPKSEAQQKNIKISEGTKQQIKAVQNTSGEVVAFTHQGIKAIFDIQVSLGQAAVSKISQNIKTGDQKSTNPKLEYLRNVGRQSLASCIEIIDALDTAVGTVGKTFAENSKEVIKQRYGEDAEECAEIFAQTGGNAYGAYKDAKGLGGKAMATKQGKITAQEIGKKI